jgi:hypothetical protein
MAELIRWKPRRGELIFCAIMAVLAIGTMLAAEAGKSDIASKRHQSRIEFASNQFDACVTSVKIPRRVSWCECYSDRLANFVWPEDGSEISALPPDQYQILVEAEKSKIGQVCDAIVGG